MSPVPNPLPCPAGFALRAPQIGDEAAVQDLIGRCYGEYGDRLHLGACDADLVDLQASYPAQGKPFIVLVRLADRKLVGTHAVLPSADEPGHGTYRRLYLDSALRGKGFGQLLMAWAEAEARRLDLRRIGFWSDTRFTRAHAFFARQGYHKDGRERTCQDGWVPYSEFHFTKEL